MGEVSAVLAVVFALAFAVGTSALRYSAFVKVQVHVENSECGR